MKVKRSMIAGMVLSLMVFTSVPAAPKPDSVRVATTPLKNQTLCPVMKKGIDSTVYTDIQGQRVYHCCRGCEKKLRGNPDKYFEEAAKEGVVFQNVQKSCPISGKPIDTTFDSFYKGRHIYFCSSECANEFATSPAEYLKKLDQSTKVEGRKSDDHSGHGH